MYLPTFVFAILLIGVNCRYVYREYGHPHGYLVDSHNIIEDDLEDVMAEEGYEPIRPAYLSNLRVRRQLQGVMSTNPDGSANIAAKFPLAGNDHNALSAIASGSGLKNGGYNAAGGGLAFDNVNGHGASLTGMHIPGFGDQLTAAGKVALIHTPDHKLNANAFITKNMPNIPNIPDFNTKGASVDYLFKDRVGGSFGVANTDLFKKTDYSAMGNLNLFKNPTSSLDLNAGFTKSVSPFLPSSSWQPAGGLTFSKYF